MKNKKLIWKRIAIFLIAAFLPTWILGITLNVKLGYENWSTEPRYMILAMLLMLFPAIATVVTRMTTKEGWKNSLLHLRVQGHIRWYAASVIIPLLIFGISGILCSLYVKGEISLASVTEETGESLKAIIYQIIFNISLAVAVSFNTFGEEFGWRGYLYPKLEELFGIPGTVLIGGIIWGIWHLPITVCGHNFGTEYWGYPWLGVILMCLFCTGIGAVLMLLTKKTDSVYPASIAHSVINNAAQLVLLIFIFDSEESLKGLTVYKFLLPAVLVAGGICTALMMLDERKKRIAAEEQDEID